MGFKQMNGATVSSPNESSETDLFILEQLSILELISFLKTSFQKTNFEKVGMILTSREESMKAEIKKNKEEDESLRIKIVELERKLREEKERFELLKAKFGELEFAKFVACEELEKYKRNCGMLKEKVVQLEEDCSILTVREQRDQEIIKGLFEELERKEKELNQTSFELKDLGCAKRRAKDEVNVWKRKYGILEARALQLLDDNPGLIERERSAKKGKGDKISCEMNRNQSSPKQEVGYERREGTPKPVIEISDDDDKMNAEVRHLMDHVMKETISQKISTVIHPDERNFNAMDKDNRSNEEDFVVTAATRRRCFSSVVTSDEHEGGGGDDGYQDRIPIGRVKMKRPAEVVDETEKSTGP